MTNRSYLFVFSAISMVVCIVVARGITMQEERDGLNYSKEVLSRLHGAAPAPRKERLSPLMQKAHRLDARLRKHGMASPGPAAVAKAIEERSALMSKQVTVTLENGETPVTIDLTLRQHPDWIQLSTTAWSAAFIVNADAIRASLERGDISQLRLLRHSEVLSTARDNKNVLRAQTTPVAKPGYQIDTAGAARDIATAFASEHGTVTLRSSAGEPTVIMTMPDGSKKTLTLLATGLSDFADSTPGRLWNVHKSVDERVNNIVVPSGEIFSLVDALDAPVTLEKGWKLDKGLFGGGVALTPGAGICQSATTIYRAALLAGLPIVQKRNHSLFVDHYEFFGIGLDATVFPGFHDVRFKNDTGEYLVIQAYTEGDTVFVNFFGRDDGRKTTMDGPYFAGAKNRHPAVRALSHHQIAWARTVTFADGSEKAEPIYATYAQPLWGSLSREYSGEGMRLLRERQ